MAKKYFTGFCVMNSADLRANPLHHSCLVFFEGDCNEFGQLRRPLKVVDAYGFYSHPIPERPSLLTPLSLFAYAAGVPRISGNYGEWRRENIHDLALGRGLSGRLFEMNENQFQSTQGKIKHEIQNQISFFTGENTIQEKEEHYQREVDIRVNQLIQMGIDSLDAEDQARESLPVRQFAPSCNCKVAALDLIESSYEKPTKKLHEFIKSLKSEGLSSIIPRFTYDLDNITIHAETDNWKIRGTQSKYPYYDWAQITTDKDFNMFVVDFGNRYIDQKGNDRWISNLPENALAIIRNLKIVGRVCEINLADADFKRWNHRINSHVKKIAACENIQDRDKHVNAASDYLYKLLSDSYFIEKTSDKLPAYLNSELRFLSETVVGYSHNQSRAC